MEFEDWMTCCCGKRLKKLNRVSWAGIEKKNEL